MPASTRFVILSVQRSGSSMLVHDLRSHPDLMCYGEVYRRAKEGPVSYTEYKARLPWRPPGPHLDRLFDRPESAVGMKIMYNHLRLPLLKSALLKRRVKVIHLVRENVLKQLVSSLVASERGHFASTAPVGLTRVECPVDGLVDALDRRRHLIEKHRRWCRRFDNVELTYEELVADRGEQHIRLLAYLGVDSSVPLEGGRVKVNPDNLEAVVTNYEQMVRTLAGTRYTSLLD